MVCISSFCVPGWVYWVVGIAVVSIIVGSMIFSATHPKSQEQASKKIMPVVGMIYPIKGTCQAQLVIDSVDLEEESCIATLRIPLPVGAKLVNLDETDEGYKVTYDDGKGGGGIYNWSWDDFEWPDEIKDFDVCAENVQVIAN
jgi:hypothetical protein